MPVVDAYRERKFQKVMEETWGHLRAKPGTRYKGHMTFVHSLEGYTVLIEFEFGDLDCSPWLHEDTEEFMEAVIDKAIDKTGETPKGAVYRFKGEYVVYKNSRRKFVGRTKRIRLPQVR